MSKEDYLIEIVDLGIETAAGYKNLVAVLDYSKQTRKIVRDLELENKNLQKQIIQQNLNIDNLQKQITALQIKMMQINNITG